MFSFEFIESDLIRAILIPVLIFFMRIADVSIGTIRIIYVSRGNRKIAPILGFFEIFIWVLAISNIIKELDNWFNYIAYASGFATGNYIGMKIEERLAIGVSLIRIITKKELGDLSNTLSEKGFPTTTLDGHGQDDDVSIIYTIVKRKKLNEATSIILKYYPHAFYTIEDIRYLSHDNYKYVTKGRKSRRLYSYIGWRKGK